MGYIVGALAIAAAAFGITGGYRAFKFVRGIMTYKARATAERVAAPAAFLACAGEGARGKELFRLNDGVMGGRSQSELEVSKSDVTFTGVINTNGGGFASFRTHGDERPLGLPDATAELFVDATGDGQRYKMTLYEADSWDMRAVWCHDFVATEQRETHTLPILAFRASRQGRPVNPVFAWGTPGLHLSLASNVTGIGFSLSLYTSAGEPNPDFGAGPFRLVVHGVTSASRPVRQRAAE